MLSPWPSSRTDGRRDLAAEELDRAEDPLVRDAADRELHEEAVVPEDLVLEEDLLDDLLGGADEVRPAQRGRGVVVRTRHRRPAALAADAVHRLRTYGNDSSSARCELSAM